MHIDMKKVDFSNELQYGSDSTICPDAGHSFPVEDGQPLRKIRKHFLKFYLDVSYYLCVIPYKFIETREGTIKKESCRFQQILCIAVQSTAILDMATRLRSTPYGSVSKNPRMYFDIFISFVHLTVIITFCYSMWTKSKQFCWLVKIVQQCPIVSLWYPKKINWIMSLITLMYVIMALLNPLFNENDGYSWEDLFNQHVSRGRYMLFFSSTSQSTLSQWNNRQNNTNYMSSTDKIRIVNNFFQFPDVLFALCSYFAHMTQWIVVYHADLMVNVMALTLWCATSFFVHTLKQQACKQAVLNYEALKKLTTFINAVAGTVVLTYTVDSILYYATHLESLFTGTNWFSKAVVLQFLLSSASWLHFASCACLQMNRFRDWIRQESNRSVLPSNSISIMLLLDEISTNTVGLSGNGLFTINYKFMAQALTTVMTYFILVIQFNK